MLFLTTQDVEQVTTGLIRADALIGTLAADPSLRGALDALALVAIGVERGETKLDGVTRPMVMAAETVEAAIAGRTPSFSWHALAAAESPQPGELRRYLQVEPVLVLARSSHDFRLTFK